jgi:hypothetical protein
VDRAPPLGVGLAVDDLNIVDFLEVHRSSLGIEREPFCRSGRLRPFQSMHWDGLMSRLRHWDVLGRLGKRRGRRFGSAKAAG